MKHTLLLITALSAILLASCATTKAELTDITLNGKNYLDMRFTDAEGAPIPDLERDISVEVKGTHYGKIKARTDEGGRVFIKKIPKSTGYYVFLSPEETPICAQIQFTAEKKQKNKQKAKLVGGLPCAAYGAMKDGESVCEAKSMTDESGSVRFENISGYCIHLETQQRITRLSY